MNKYQLYKPSRVEWVGDIPNSWEETRLKYIGNLYGGLTGKSGEDFKQDDNPNNKPYIPYTNIFRNTYISKNHVDYVVLKDGENQNKVQKFDLFFLMSSETYQDLGKPCILIDDIEELYLNSFCKGFRVNKNYVNPLFLNYQLLGSIHKELISIEGRGFTRINLRQDRLNETPVFLPPLQEQLQIVQFLDEKTSLIDNLVSRKELKITLLKEQRTSLINEVVTKGLNPNVKMKDSEVEYIGEIPESWKMMRVSNFGTFFKGNGIKKDEVRDEGIPCIRYGEIYTKYDRIVYNPISFIDLETSKNSIQIKKGDILFTGSGETLVDIGKSLLYYGDEEIFVGGDIIVLRLKEGFNPLYLSYLLNSSFVQYQKSLMGRGEIIVHIYSKNIKEIKTPIPSLKEQLQIVEHLDTKTKEIDDLVQIEKKKIDLLKEYRQSLISEVVTGKVKVTQ